MSRYLWEYRPDNKGFGQRLKRHALFIFALPWFIAVLAIVPNMAAIDALAEFYESRLMSWVLAHQLLLAVSCLSVAVLGCLWWAKRKFL